MSAAAPTGVYRLVADRRKRRRVPRWWLSFLTGASSSAIADLEAGRPERVTPDQFREMCVVLDISRVELLAAEGEAIADRLEQRAAYWREAGKPREAGELADLAQTYRTWDWTQPGAAQ